jgi:hypothetical protein
MQTVTTSFIPQLVMENRSKSEELLCSVSDVSLTTDEWTDRRTRAFMGVTAHIYNVMTGRSTSHILAFRAFRGTHSGQRIADELEAVINEFQLRSKIRFIVSDNASAMKRAMHILFCSMHPSLMSKRALTNTLTSHHFGKITTEMMSSKLPVFPRENSAVLLTRCNLLQGWVAVLQTVGWLKKAFAKCSKLSSLVHQSALFRSSFEAEFGSGRSIPMTNDTRWNSILHQC